MNCYEIHNMKKYIYLVCTIVHIRPEIDAIDHICPNNDIYVYIDRDQAIDKYYHYPEIKKNEYHDDYSCVEIVVFEWNSLYNIYIPTTFIPGRAFLNILGIVGMQPSNVPINQDIQNDIQESLILYIVDGELDYFTSSIAIIFPSFYEDIIDEIEQTPYQILRVEITDEHKNIRQGLVTEKWEEKREEY